MSLDALSSGSGISIDSTSTAGDSYKLLNITSSGANVAESKTRYGSYISMTGTGTSSTNIASYLSASGASNNYGLIVAAGNVGIGDTSPTSLFTVGSGDLFQITSSGYARAVDGAQGTPAFSFTGDTDTGMYRIGDNNIGWAVNSAGELGLSTDLLYPITNAGLSLGSDANEWNDLWIDGTAYLDALTMQGNIVIPDGGTIGQAAGPLLTFDDTSNYLEITGGNVGIGSSSPTDKLTVQSDSAGAVVSLLRLENLGSATIDSGAKINFVVNRTTGGATVIGSIESSITNIDNSNYSGKMLFKTATNGPAETIMEIGDPNIKLNRPLSVDIAGDVGISYDLAFLSAGTSYITSQGPLIVSAGDPNHAENLTLTTQSNEASGDFGVCSSSTTDDMDDSSKTWANDEWIGGTISIISGTGAGQIRTILDNDANTIVIDNDNTTEWNTNPDITSVYKLAYARAGDIIANIQNSDIAYGGFRINGMDQGGYIFKVGPDGDVNIGGQGSGGSDLTVKQNLTLTGGNIVVNQISAPSISCAKKGDHTSGATTYEFKVTAINDNGETTGSTQCQVTNCLASLDADNYIQITWTAVSGALGYKIYGCSGADCTEKLDNDSIIPSPTCFYNVDDSSFGSTDVPSSNTTGGKLAINTTSPARRIEILEADSIPVMRLTQTSGSVFAEFEVAASTGDLTITTAPGSGGIKEIILSDENLKIFDSSSFTMTLSETGNLVVENTVYAYDFDKCWQDDDGDGVSDWITVPGNPKFGTQDFCVMKYEAKCGSADGTGCNDASDTPVSKAANLPWRATITQTEAIAACKRIGADYHLITEPEWMTIAYNITQTVINDLDSDTGLQMGNGNSTNSVAYAAGSDPIVSGCDIMKNLEHSDNAWSSTCQLRGTNGTTADFGYTSDGNSKFSVAYDTGADSKAHIRTHVLSNSEVIWDIAGNVWEWTNATVEAANEPHDGTAADGEWCDYFSAAEPNDPISNWGSIDDLSDIVGSGLMFANSPYSNAGAKTFEEMLKPIEYDPYNLDTQLRADNNGIGRLYSDAGDTGTRAFRRGGLWYDASDAGVFALNLNNTPSDASAGVGFRCAR